MHHKRAYDKKRIFLYVVISVFSVCLLFLVAQSLHTKPTHDDYYFLTPITSNSTQWNWDYWNRNGRLSDTFLYSILYPIPHIIQIFPAITIILLGVALFIFTRTSRKYLLKIQDNNCSTLVDTSITLLGVLVCLLTVPSIYASYYWVAGGVPHTWSFILLIIFSALVTRSFFKPNKTLIGDILIFSIFALFIALLYEAVAISLFLIPALSILLIAVWNYKNKSKLFTSTSRALWLTITSGAIGTIFMRFGPGALDRYGDTIGNSKTIGDLMIGFPHNYLASLMQIVQNTHHKSLFLILFTVTLLISLIYLRSSLKPKRLLIVTSVVALVSFAIISFNIVAIWFGMSIPLMIRSYFVVSAAFAITAIAAGLTIGQYLKDTELFRRGIIIGVFSGASISLLALNLLFIPALLSIQNEFSSFAKSWNRQNAQIISDKDSGYCHINIPRMYLNGTSGILKSPHYWLNHEMDKYYGIPFGQSNCGITGEGKIIYYFYNY